MALSPEFLYLFSYSLVIIMKTICFILSYKIVKLGYELIKSGVKGEFKFASNFIGFKADLVSLSPGLLFLLLGVLFMMVAIYVNKSVSYHRDATTTPQISMPGDSTFADSMKVPKPDDLNLLFPEHIKNKP